MQNVNLVYISIFKGGNHRSINEYIFIQCTEPLEITQHALFPSRGDQSTAVYTPYCVMGY